MPGRGRGGVGKVCGGCALGLGFALDGTRQTRCMHGAGIIARDAGTEGVQQEVTTHAEHESAVSVCTIVQIVSFLVTFVVFSSLGRLDEGQDGYWWSI